MIPSRPGVVGANDYADLPLWRETKQADFVGAMLARALPPADGRTLAEARGALVESKGRGECCPLCGQDVKVYPWKLLSGMAATLVWMVNNWDGSGWMHLNSKDTPDWIKADRSYPKLVHWGLIEPQPNEDDDKKRCSGMWRPTAAGVDFVARGTSVPRHVFVYNGLCLGFSMETITVREAIGEKFRWSEMAGTIEPMGIARKG